MRWRTREEPGFSLVDMQSSVKIKLLLTFYIQFWCYNFKYIFIVNVSFWTDDMLHTHAVHLPGKG